MMTRFVAGMRVCFGARLLFSCLLLAGCAASQQTDRVASTVHNDLAPREQVVVYKVNKSVNEWGSQEDLSTPENAYVTIARVMKEGGNPNWARVSEPRLATMLNQMKQQTPPASAPIAEALAMAKIAEVRIYDGQYAAVAAEMNVAGSMIIDARWLRRVGNQWLNCGEDRYLRLDQVAEQFAVWCSRQLPPVRRSAIPDAEAYLQNVTKDMQNTGRPPLEFLMQAASRHRLTIVGEIHHRPQYWRFNSELVADKRFSDHVGSIYLELPSDHQELVDKFLGADRLDVAPIVQVLRDSLWMGWPDQAMLDFFVAVWTTNHRLPADKRYRLVLVDTPRPWDRITDSATLRRHDAIDRDQAMAQAILRDVRQKADSRNGVFIVGFYHAIRDIRRPVGGYPFRSAAWYLSKELMQDVYSIVQHGPVISNDGRVVGRACLGLLDAAFIANRNQPMAFPLATSPFGAQPFDRMCDDVFSGRYRDAFDAYLFLVPLEDECFSPLIPGFFDSEFVQELGRRARIVGGVDLKTILGTTSEDTSSVVGYMQRTWGRPRGWGPSLGSTDAWRYGDIADWLRSYMRF